MLKYLDAYLKPLGFRRNRSGDIYYYKEGVNTMEILFIIFYNYGGIDCSSTFYCIREVEEIVRLVFDGTSDYIIQANYGKWNLGITLKDLPLENPKELFAIDTEDQVEAISTWYLDYLQGDRVSFIERYSYLPNVLERMDGLKSQGLEWQDPNQGILYGSIDADFRGLIISKLCNDPNLEAKIEISDRELLIPQYKEWHPYYEKLKQLLPSIEPKYNV